MARRDAQVGMLPQRNALDTVSHFLFPEINIFVGIF
jgi:hypothetical protein